MDIIPAPGGSGDVSSAVILAPTTSSRNVIQSSTASVVPLTIKGAASQTADLFKITDSADAVLFLVGPDSAEREVPIQKLGSYGSDLTALVTPWNDPFTANIGDSVVLRDPMRGDTGLTSNDDAGYQIARLSQYGWVANPTLDADQAIYGEVLSVGLSTSGTNSFYSLIGLDVELQSNADIGTVTSVQCGMTLTGDVTNHAVALGNVVSAPKCSSPDGISGLGLTMTASGNGTTEIVSRMFGAYAECFVTNPHGATEFYGYQCGLVSANADDGWPFFYGDYTVGPLWSVTRTGAMKSAPSDGKGPIRFIGDTAPADGDLEAEEISFYYNPDNTSPTLNIKAKTADGTLASATIPLTPA